MIALDIYFSGRSKDAMIRKRLKRFMRR